MNTKQTQIAMMAAGAGLCVVGIGMMTYLEHKKETKRKADLEAFIADNEKFIQNLTTYQAYLDRKLETAKFWEIVTRD